MQSQMMSGMLGQGDVLKMQAQLFKKLMNVVEKMENVKKSGYNSHQKYHYSTEQDLIDLLLILPVDTRILGVEYQSQDFTGRKEGTEKGIEHVFNSRDHSFSSSSLRKRVALAQKDKK